MSERRSGFDIMNERYEQIAAENERLRLEEERRNAELIDLAAQERERVAQKEVSEQIHREAIEKRAVSEEVSALNDKAMFDIWGSDMYDVVDPETNEVIGTADQPLHGLLDDMRSNPRYGKTAEKRKRAAAKYEKDAVELTDEGFELCQAKLIMDLRHKDVESSAKLTAQYISMGLSPTAAARKTKEVFTDFDNSRKKLIRNGGAFTSSDYERLLKGENLYDEDGNYLRNGSTARVRGGRTAGTNAANQEPQPGTEPQPEPGEEPQPTEPAPAQEPTREERIRDAQRYSLDEALDEAYEMNENEYAQLSAIRERSGWLSARNRRGNRAATRVAPGQRVTAEMVEESRERLEDIRIRNHEAMRQRLIDAGATTDEINNILVRHDAMFVRTIGDQQLAERMRQAGFSREGSLKARFYDWWARQGGGGDRFFSRTRLKGTVNKSLVMAAFGVPAGIVATFAAPVFAAGLGVAGAAAASRLAVGVARGFASSRINKNANVAVGQLQAGRRVELAGSHVLRHYQEQANNQETAVAPTVTESFARATASEVNRNRRRTTVSLGIAALSAFGLGYLGEHFLNASAGVHHINGNNAGHSGGAPKGTGSHGGTSHGGGSQPQPKGGANTVPSKSGASASSNGEITPSNQAFEVKPGDGIINEISRYAQAHGKNISPARADQIYAQLAAHHGQNIIQMDGGGQSEYLINPGDWGISHPGTGHWYPGVENELDKLLNESSNN